MKNIILCLLVTCGLSLSFTGSYSTTNFPNGVSTGTLNATNAVVVGVTNISTIGDGYATINGPLTATSITTTGVSSANSLVSSQGLQLGDTYQLKWGSGVPNAYLYGSGSTKTLGFGTNQTDRLVISANGNIGINNANPLQTLDVVGTVQGTSLTDGTATMAGGAITANRINVAGTVSASALQVNVGTSASGSDVLNRLGNTQGTAGSTGTLALSPTDLKSIWRYDNNSGATSFGNMQSGAYPLDLYTAGVKRLRIDGTGLVGIACTPSTQLEVAGTVSANGLSLSRQTQAFVYNQYGSTTLMQNVSTTVNFDTVYIDNTSSFASNLFTVPSFGQYQISVIVGAYSAAWAAGTLKLDIYYTDYYANSQFALTEIRPVDTTVGYNLVRFSGTITPKVGTTIFAKITQTSTATVTIGAIASRPDITSIKIVKLF